MPHDEKTQQKLSVVPQPDRQEKISCQRSFWVSNFLTVWKFLAHIKELRLDFYFSSGERRLWKDLNAGQGKSGFKSECLWTLGGEGSSEEGIRRYAAIQLFLTSAVWDDCLLWLERPFFYNYILSGTPMCLKSCATSPAQWIKGSCMKTTNKTKKSCEQCGSQNLKACRVPYPVRIKNQHLNIQRVSVRECLDCHIFMPTKSGNEKIARSIMAFMDILDEHTFPPV